MEKERGCKNKGLRVTGGEPGSLRKWDTLEGWSLHFPSPALVPLSPAGGSTILYNCSTCEGFEVHCWPQKRCFPGPYSPPLPHLTQISEFLGFPSVDRLVPRIFHCLLGSLQEVMIFGKPEFCSSLSLELSCSWVS